MCGIAGIVSKWSIQISLPTLQKATGLLAHRGPEEESFWMNEESTVAFGHRRLCIIDLTEKAAQPMHYAGRYTIIYNGEIYNYKELKKELEAKGCLFNSYSDTEVILAAYAEWGAGCLQRFDGAFAFAIWMKKSKCFLPPVTVLEKSLFSFFMMMKDWYSLQK